MAIRVIDDTKLQNIAVAIQSKDNGGQMTVDEMAGRIEAIPSDYVLLKSVTLDSPVSEIKIDIDTTNYQAFILAPEININNVEWVYLFLETESEEIVNLNFYSPQIIVNDGDWSYSKHGNSLFLMLDFSNFGVFSLKLNDAGDYDITAKPIKNESYKAIILRLYNQASRFRSGSYKLFGRMSKLNVGQR